MENPASSNTSNRTSDEENLIGFPTFVSMRKALLSLVQRQLSTTNKSSCNVSKSSVNKRFQANRGHGDATVQKEACMEFQKYTKVKKEEEMDEEIVGLECTMKFDSIDDLTEYKKQYVGRLLEKSNGQPFSQRYSDNLESRTFADKRNVSSSSPILCTCYWGSKPKYLLSWLLIFAIITLAILGKLVVCPLTEGLSLNYLDQIEWPWSVFIKEPMLKGLYYSSSFEDYFNWT